MGRGRRWLVRLVALVVVVQVAWVVLANAALHYGVVSALLNRRPEKLEVRWDTARSW